MYFPSLVFVIRHSGIDIACRVQVMFTITKDGTTADVIVVDHEPANNYIFHDACLNAVASAKFDPQPAPVQKSQFVCRFQLLDEDDDCNKIPERVVALKNAGDYGAALLEVDKILECYDTVPMMVTHAAESGWIYLEMEDFSRVIESFNNALRPRPPIPFIYLGRALAHECAGNPELAEADFLATYEVGMAIDPERFMRALNNKYAYARDRVLQT